MDLYNKIKSNVSDRYISLRERARLEVDLIRHSMLLNRNNIDREAYINERDIPKVIHYCWYGNSEMDDLSKHCIASWKKNLPDYRFVLWNEDNSPIDKYNFTKDAYKAKKYIYVSDVIRLHAIYNYGGIYLDTDVEVIKPFDEYLQNNAFVSYESPNLISIGQFGAKPFHPWIKELLLFYEMIDYCVDYTVIANSRICSKIARKYYNISLNGCEQVFGSDVRILPREILLPNLNEFGEYELTDDTCCIHHYKGFRERANMLKNIIR